MAVIVCILLVLHVPMHGSLRALSIPSLEINLFQI